MSTAISQITNRFGKTLPPSSQQPQQPFRSSVTWTSSDWQQPLDRIINRICRAAWLHPTKPTNSTDQEPLDFTDEQFQILLTGQTALEQARAANDMPRYRLILQQYEEKAMGFLQQNRVKRLDEKAPF